MATADSALRFNLFAKDQTGPGIKSADSNFSKLGKGLVTKFAAAAGAIGAVSLFKGFIDEARESEKVSRLTAAAIKATGGAAKISANDVGKLATALSNKTAIDDEVIQSGQNILLTFKGVRNEVGKGNDIFTQASKAALDMTAGMNGGNVTAENLKGTSVQLGKALNDPIKGITALARAGVTFTDDQKKTIKKMVETGNILGAQKIILGELSTEFGGAAAAAADPAQKAKVAWANLQEQIGMGVLPILNKVMGFISSRAIPAISKFVENIQHGGGGFAKFREGLAQVGVFISGTVVPLLQRFGDWFVRVGWPAIQKFASAFWKDLQPAIASIVTSFQQNLRPALENAIAKFKEAWPTIQRVGLILGEVAGFILTKVVPVLIQLYSRYLATVITVFANVFSAVWRFIGVLIDLGKKVGEAGAAFGRFVGAVSSAIGRAYTAVRDGIGKVVSTIAGLPGKALSAVGKLGSTLYQVGIDLIEGFLRGIRNKAGEIAGTIKSFITDKIPGFIKKPLGIGSPSKLTMQYGQWLSQGLAIGVAKDSDKVGDAVAAMVDSLKAKIDEVKDFGKTIKGSFTGLGDLSSIDTTIEDGKEGGLAALLAGLKERAANASQFAATIKRLRKAGLNEAALADLRDAGPEGGLKAAQQVLTGGAAAIDQVNALTKQLSQTGQVFANRESRAMYGFSGNPNVAMNGKQEIVVTYQAGGGGDEFMAWLRKQIRVKGGNAQKVLGSA